MSLSSEETTATASFWPVYLTRRYDFSASHRLFNPSLSNQDNEAIFGQCNNPNGHGHNYELEVTLKGLPDEKTGMVVDITLLDEWVQTHLLDAVDHKHLNLDVAFFEGIIPTAENIVRVFWQQLAPVLQTALPPQTQLYRLRLQESKNNWAEYGLAP